VSDSLFAGWISNATATLGVPQPGATTTATLTFTTQNPWPADGTLTLYIPTVFGVTGAVVGAQSGVDGSLEIAVASGAITLTRTGGTPVSAGTDVSITLANVVNPATAQATYGFQLSTRTNTGLEIDRGLTRGVVIGCPATITKAPMRGTNVPLGGNAWQYPDGVRTPSWGTDVAYIQSVEASDYLVASDFQFPIPDGAAITGIRFDVERDYWGYAVVDSAVRIVKTAIGPSDRSIATPWTTQPVAYGGPADLWGESWSAADIESSTFGIAMAVRAVTPGMRADVRVGYVTATVFLSCP
jgi:hypothetical protein